MFDPNETTPQQRMLAVQVLAAVIAAVKPSLGLHAEAVLEVVRSLVETFMDGVSHKVSHDDVKKAVEERIASLKAVDARFDAAIAEKFGKKDDEP